MILLLFITVCIVGLSGCSNYRHLYIECAAGAGVNDDYYLEYLVYDDFGKPSLEKTTINSFFSVKENAYAFAKKYQILLIDGIGDIHVAEKDKGYEVTVELYETAEFKTFSEYKEKVKSLNKKEKVCTINQ